MRSRYDVIYKWQGILVTALMLLLSLITKAQSVTPVNGGYYNAGGYGLSWTLAEPFTPSLKVDSLTLTQGFEQPIKPLPPVAPANQTVCSDTAYTFTFNNIKAGAGAGYVEWSLHSNFDSSHVIASGGSISLTVAAGTTDTVWLRSLDSTTYLKSEIVSFIVRLGIVPIQITPIPVDTIICFGDSTIVSIPTSQTGVRYDLLAGQAIVMSNYGNGGMLSFPTGVTDTNTVFRVIATDTLFQCSRILSPSITVAVAQPVGIPEFVSGDSLMYTGDTSQYVATAANSIRIRYSIITGSATIDSVTGWVKSFASTYTVRATAIGGLNCTSAYTDYPVAFSNTPAPPIPPDAQAACSDAAQVLSFKNVIAGRGADQIEWDTHSDFSSSHTIPSPADISLTVGSEEYITIWLRSRNSTTDSFSRAVTTFASVSSCNYVTSPIYFEKNIGQWDSTIRYQSSTNGALVRFLNTGISYCSVSEAMGTPGSDDKDSMQGLVWNLHFDGMNSNATLVPDSIKKTIKNYFIGNDSTLWYTSVPVYANLRYNHLYDSINLRYYCSSGSLKYDFELLPGSRISDIKMKLEGISDLTINGSGDLNIGLSIGTFSEKKPFSYQLIDGIMHTVDLSYNIINDSTYGFTIDGSWDSTHLLIIDPLSLIWGTFLGDAGTKANTTGMVAKTNGTGITTGLNGIYLTGFSRQNSTFPLTAGVYGGSSVNTIFVTKMTLDGAGLVYSTLIGGGCSASLAPESYNGDQPMDIKVNGNGEAVITGYTPCTTFPIRNPNHFGPTSSVVIPGTTQAFCVALNYNSSSLLFSTVFGSTSFDIGNKLWVNKSTVYLVGSTMDGSTFPAAFNPNLGKTIPVPTVFLEKFDWTTTGAPFSMLFQGDQEDDGYSVFVNNAGNIYLTGRTGSRNFNGVATPGASALFDAFIVSLTNAGAGRWTRFFGGSGSCDDAGVDIAYDNMHSAVYVVGGSSKATSIFPTFENCTPDEEAETGWLIEYNDPPANASPSHALAIVKLQHPNPFASTYGNIEPPKFLPYNGTGYTNGITISGLFIDEASGDCYITGQERKDGGVSEDCDGNNTCDWDEMHHGPDPATPVLEGKLGFDLFLSRLNTTVPGNDVFTFIGSTWDDYFATAPYCYIDPNTQKPVVYLAGTTHGSDFPTTAGTFAPTKLNGIDDCPVILRINMDHLKVKITGNPRLCDEAAVLHASMSGTTTDCNTLTYKWGSNQSPSGFGTGVSTTGTDVTVTASGTYSVTVSNNCGCSVSASVTVNASNCYCGGSSDITTFDDNVDNTTVATVFGSSFVHPPAGTVIAFNQKLDVKPPTMLVFDHCDILMGAGAEIDIESGGVLEVSSSYLHSCTKMWQGINVKPGGRLLIIGPPNDPSEIDDALYAVQLNNGSLFKSVNAKYHDNFIGIYYNGLGDPYNYGQSFVLQGTLFGNSFAGTRPLKPGFSGMNTGGAAAYHPSTGLNWAFAGIHTIDLANLTIGAANQLPNVFDSIANGIITERCNLTVHNCRFNATHAFGYSLNVQEGGQTPQTTIGLPFQGNGILATDFHGILFTPTFGLKHTLVETGLSNSNLTPTFTKCDHGIVTDRMHVDISGNYMLNNYTPATPITGQVGIKVILNPLGIIKVVDNGIDYLNSCMQFLLNDPVGQLDVEKNQANILGNSSFGLGLGVFETGGRASRGLLNDLYQENSITMNTGAVVGSYFNVACGFYAYNNDVFMKQFATSWIGMAYSGCASFTDEANTVHGPAGLTPTTIGGGYPFGITYGSCTGLPDHTSHRCNIINEVYTGMIFTGHNSYHTFISGNQFNQNAAPTSPQLMNDGLVVYNGDISPQRVAGNQWYGRDNSTTDFIYSGLRVLSIFSTVPQFTTTNMQGTTYFPLDREISPTGMFTPPTTIPAPTQDSSCTTDGGGHHRGLADLDVAIINDTASFDSSQFPSQLLWTSKNEVYRELLINPDLLDSTANADSFFIAVQHSPMGQLTSVDSIWYRGSTPGSGLAESWINKLQIIDSLQNLIPVLDSLLSDTSSGTKEDSATWDYYRLYYDSVIVAMDTAVDTAMITFFNNRSSAASAALALNQSIIPGNTIESNMVLYNEIYLSTVAVDSAIFDSLRISQLYYLAGQCPLSGGNAVYAARSLLSLLVDTLFDDMTLCSLEGERMKHVQIPINDTLPVLADTLMKKLSIKMYPNPAKDYTILQFNQDINPLQLKITDAVGETLVNEPISTTMGYYRINTTKFASGLYYVTLHRANNKIFADKLSIFK